MSRDPLADARREGVRVEIASLGAWAPARVVAEYDRVARTIRVNAVALERVRTTRGADTASALLAAAVAHELYHHAVAEGRSPSGDAEIRAAAFARETYGIDQSAFEIVLAE